MLFNKLPLLGDEDCLQVKDRHIFITAQGSVGGILHVPSFQTKALIAVTIPPNHFTLH